MVLADADADAGSDSGSAAGWCCCWTLLPPRWRSFMSHTVHATCPFLLYRFRLLFHCMYAAVIIYYYE